MKLKPDLCKHCARLCKQNPEGRWICIGVLDVLYDFVVWLSTVHHGIVLCDHTSKSKQYCNTTSPFCDSAPDKLWENEGSASMYIMPLIDCSDEIGGYENTQTWSTTWKQATRPLLLCYRRNPNQSAVHCSLRLNCTAMFLILVMSAVYTQTMDSTQEMSKVHVNASALSTSAFHRKEAIM